MKRLFSTIVLALCVTTGMASAKGLAYDCKLKDASAQLGWIPEVLFIGHLDGAKTATVSDPITLHFNDRQPIDAKVVNDTDKRLTVKWSIQTPRKKGQRAKFSYRASYIKATGALVVTAKPLNFSNVFNGQGTCTVSKLK